MKYEKILNILADVSEKLIKKFLKKFKKMYFKKTSEKLENRIVNFTNILKKLRGNFGVILEKYRCGSFDVKKIVGAV